ncbi:GNAT family N-acetyltransferase [Denitrobaculum tricleocarpae]|uniref:GNAT family N-acetyltransferase n=2 Tax=Denitrobaculum tricleocarpae TaxID=2591009 RepID=A0A545TRU9_9PROT|nr:GNAT family N-acetyltransferase [Denitrobaculum tricleocarpae]
MPRNITLRLAKTEDCPALSRLALSSKAHWGYDDAFIKACVPALTVTPDLLAAHHVVIAERASDDGSDKEPPPLGFYALSKARPEAEVECCFVDPAAIGSGVGGVLWRDMEAFARNEGVTGLSLVADPNAVGFYRHMGMEEAGFTPSNVFGPDRPLPVLKKTLPGISAP